MVNDSDTAFLLEQVEKTRHRYFLILSGILRSNINNVDRYLGMSNLCFECSEHIVRSGQH